MSSTTIAALESAFADDVEEIIERVLLVHRPILSQVVWAHFRVNLQQTLARQHFQAAWCVEDPGPAHGIGPLTAAQVALLGGTRPRRVLHGVAFDLDLSLDGGDRKAHDDAGRILLASEVALDNLADYHVVVPAKNQKDGLQKYRELAEIGLAVQIAAVMGELYERRLWAGLGMIKIEPDDESELIQRYFAGVLRAFMRIKLSRKDQDVFREHYLDDGDIEELAVEREGLDAEVERRRGFLVRLAAALAVEVAGPPDGGSGDPVALPGAGGRALSRATARAARPRKR